MTRLNGERPNPELDMPEFVRGEQPSREEVDVRQHLVADVLHLRQRKSVRGQQTGSEVHTTTGWTTATSFRDGAGWYRGRGDSPPGVPVGGRKTVDSPRRRSAKEIEDVMDMRWWWTA